VTWTRARRLFVVAWIALGILGALDQTILPRVLGTHLDLELPHLKYGYVMFNRNPRKVFVYQYAAADGVRHDLADLVETPALGYRRARLAISVLSNHVVLDELCLRATRGVPDRRLTFFVDEYHVGDDPPAPPITHALTCDAHGLRERGAGADAR
jgi:hypothetical protein